MHVYGEDPDPLIWNVVGDNISVNCIHCDIKLTSNQQINTYISKNNAYNFCDNCCTNMLLLDSPLHIPYEQKLKYKLYKFLGENR